MRILNPDKLGWLPILIVAATLIAWPAPALADDDLESGILSLNFENDIFYDTDRNYTNGVRISWLTNPDHTPDWARDAAEVFPLFPEGGTVRTEFAMGQNMYTPEDITLTDPPLDDRPYAGWLYGSLGLISETGRQLDQLGLTVGVVGPASLAEQTQKLVHSIVGADRPEGWHTQLRNEPGIVLTYEHSWRRFVSRTLITGLPFDITPHVGGAVGNVYTYANAGLTLRVGNKLPLDYGPPRIQPSLPGSDFFVSDGFAWYVFAGFDGRAVVRNIFLDGNTFRDGPSVDKKPFVGDLQFGFAIIWSGVRLSYTHVLRTREFKTQDDADNFGAMSLSARF